MNYIVPIDFSEQSKTAAQYAAALSKVWPGSVHLVHVIERYEEDSSYVPVKTLNIRKNTVFEMFNLQETLRRSFDVRTGADMVIGDFSRSVLKTAAHEKSDLIIMGMQGESGLREHLYGSNTAALMEATNLPVLAIPSEAVFKSFSHIAYVTNHAESEIEDIVALAKITAKFKALLSVVSFNSGASPSTQEIFQTAVRERVPFAAIHFEDRQAHNGAAEGLQEFALTTSVDLIGISGNQFDLRAEIAGRSVADNFRFSVDVPVLFLPSR